ncbi:Uncharacterised protein [uncultured archaeon]|nr:Uncharacterised protein [uncultured archaeon]
MKEAVKERNVAGSILNSAKAFFRLKAREPETGKATEGESHAEAVRDWRDWPWYLSPDKEGTREIIEDLGRAKDELIKKHGSSFVSFVMLGSRAKGYAAKSSDIDIRAIIVRNKLASSAEWAGIRTDVESAISNSLRDKSLRVEIGDVFSVRRMTEFVPEKGLFKEEYCIARLFAGIHFGDERTLFGARKEVIKAICRPPPEPELVWREVEHEFHSIIFGHLDDDKYEMRVSQKLRNDLKELKLPSLAEMRKEFGVEENEEA